MYIVQLSKTVYTYLIPKQCLGNKKKTGSNPQNDDACTMKFLYTMIWQNMHIYLFMISARYTIVINIQKIIFFLYENNSLMVI